MEPQSLSPFSPVPWKGVRSGYPVRANPTLRFGGGGGVVTLGGIELLDIITVGVNTQEVTFGSGGDGEYGRALDGDVDGEYILVSKIVANTPGTNHYYLLYPNGISTSQNGYRTYCRDSGRQNITQKASLVLLDNWYSTASGHCRSEISAKTGFLRTVRTRTTNGESANPHLPIFQSFDSWWTDTTTNITSFVIHATSGSNIRAGSQFHLYRRGVWL